MKTFLAIADRAKRGEGDAFPLDSARIGLIHGGHLYTYLPNTSSWLRNPSVERDYFADQTDLRYKELPEYLARYLASAMRPMNPLVARMMVEEAGSAHEAPVRSRDEQSFRVGVLRKRTELLKWVRKNGVTFHDLGLRKIGGTVVSRRPTSLQPAKVEFLAVVLQDPDMRSLGLRKGVRRAHVIDKHVVSGAVGPLNLKYTSGKVQPSVDAYQWAMVTDADRRSTDLDSE